MATHDQTGDFGWENGGVVQYTEDAKVNTARAIRDHLLMASASDPNRPTPVVRDCGGSNDTTHIWGVPNVTVGGKGDLPPPSNFATLVWEVRHRAEIGFEQGPIVPRAQPVDGQVKWLQTAMGLQLYYNARYIEIKSPDVIDGGPTGEGRLPHEPYVPTLVATAGLMSPGLPLPWNCTSRACSQSNGQTRP